MKTVRSDNIQHDDKQIELLSIETAHEMIVINVKQMCNVHFVYLIIV
jgi:hypothetical protein